MIWSYTNRFLMLFALLGLAVSGSAIAQTTATFDDDHNHAAEPAVCGFQWISQVDHKEALQNTARINPEYYQRLVASAEKGGERSRVLSVSSEDEISLPFSVFDREADAYVEVIGVLKYAGSQALIWVDVRDTGRIKQSTIDAFAIGLEEETGPLSRNPELGIIDNDHEVYGLAPVNKFDPNYVASFLLTDIRDGIAGGSVLGYFSPNDQTDDIGSNEMNLLYIDSKEGLGNQSPAAIEKVLSTLAHEFQHLIHYGRFGGSGSSSSDRLYNEGLSEEASLLNGYRDRSNNGYMNNPNQQVFGFPSNSQDGGELEMAYQRGMTFVHYVSEQFGESFLNKLVATHGRDVERLQLAMEATGFGSDWRAVLRNYAVANYLQDDYDGDVRYSYRRALGGKARTFSKQIPTDNITPASEEVTIEGFGAHYISFYKPGAFDIEFTGSGDFTVMGILVRTGGDIQVQELPKGEVHELGRWGNDYVNTVFAIVSHSGGGQNVTWTAKGVTTGVEDEQIVAGPLAFESAVPNPFAAETSITFSMENPGAVSLDIYDMQGRLVRKAVDNRQYEAGQHTVLFQGEDLPVGAYMARLTQGEKSVTRSLVLMK